MSDDAERGRIDAEKGRVKAEGERVVAEGGAEFEDSRREAEQDRVTAEGGRVAAEDARAEADTARAGGSLRQRLSRFWHQNQGAIVGALVGIVAALAILLAIVVGEVRQQADAGQFESFRNCIRNNINSSVVRLPRPPDPDETDADRARRTSFQAIQENLYPVVDCAAQQKTGRTVELSPAETERYIKVVQTGRFPIVEGGKVTGSRSSLLEGVKANGFHD